MHSQAQADLARDRVMRRLIAAVGDCQLKPAGDFAPFAALARAITYQQLNGTAARTIFERFIALYAPASFPEPAAVARTDAERLRSAGLSYAKIRALKDLAAKCLDGTVPETDALRAMSDADIIERLTAVRGIGRWTVEMMLMFQLGRRDILPVHDFGVCNGVRLAYGLARMPQPKALAEYGARWAPHRSIAAWYLWRAVDLERERRLPAPRGKPAAIAQIKARVKAGGKRPTVKRRGQSPRQRRVRN